MKNNPPPPKKKHPNNNQKPLVMISSFNGFSAHCCFFLSASVAITMGYSSLGDVIDDCCHTCPEQHLKHCS